MKMKIYWVAQFDDKGAIVPISGPYVSYSDALYKQTDGFVVESFIEVDYPT